MTRRYGVKKDANHVAIVDLLKKTGTPYIDTSALGCGMPDLVVNVRDRFELWEIKNRATSYGRRGLNKHQRVWAAAWQGGPVFLIHDVDEALRFLNSDMAGIQVFGGYRPHAMRYRSPTAASAAGA